MMEQDDDLEHYNPEEYGYASENPYVIDPDLLEEMHRVDLQGRILTGAMGSLLPSRSDGLPIRQVLDLGCGTAEWALEVAREHPTLEVIGVDKAPRMIEFARARSYAERLPNTTFQIADVTRPLPFGDARFDLVNGRLMQGFMKTSDWLPVVKECWRVLRPGGLLRLTETEGQCTNSAACAQYQRLFTRALRTAGMSFSPDGQDFGIVFMLRSLLEEGGFVSMQEQAHAINISFGSLAYKNTYDNTEAAMRLLMPFIVRTLAAGRSQEEEAQLQAETRRICEQARTEMQAPDFRGLWLLLSAVGEKPNQGGVSAS